MFKSRHWVRIAGGIILGSSAGLAYAVPERAANSDAGLLEQLRSNAGGQLSEAGLVGSSYRLLHSRGAQLLSRDNTTAAPLERARTFLSIYGKLLGVTDPLAQLRAARNSVDLAGNTHVHLNQTYQGLEVYGARLVVHMNKLGVTGVNGVFVRDLEGLSTTPGISAAEAAQAAVYLGQKLHGGAALQANSTRLIVYSSDLLSKRQPKPRNYLAYEVVVSNGPGRGIRERYILDAANGAQIERINGIQSVLNREIHTPTVATPPVITEGSPAALTDPPLKNDDRTAMSDRAGVLPPTPLNNLYVYAGGTYNLYKNMFGREGYDQDFIDPVTGLPKVQVQNSTYLANELCPNAYWDGVGTNYCPGFDGDDVVSHEWSHAYTEYSDGLIYKWQSGALNESYSDIYGETYDLVNGLEGLLGATLIEGDYHENGGSRWVIGEDLGDVAAQAILRDMWDPDNFTLPGGIENPLGMQAGKVTSPNYSCTGEAHSNSGVPNHAYAMLVDGKTFNGITVPGIGLVKAAHIYYQAHTHYQVPSTDFSQHADALEQSCQDLIGVELHDPTGAVWPDKITAADCDAVHATVEATELRISDKERCGYEGTLLLPEDTTPAACAAGQYEYPDFTENWDSGTLPAGWTLSQNLTGDAPYVPGWVLSQDLPAPHHGYAMFAANYKHGGLPRSGGDISSSYSLASPAITLQDAQNYLKFTHYILSEAPYDGGNLKYSVNGGDFAIVPASAMSYNPYIGNFADAPLLPLPVSDPTGLLGNNTNPLAGEPAWYGSDPGENTSEWATTIVDLKQLGLKAGDQVRFRWDFGQDSTGGALGWYVDEVAVGHCSLTPPPGTEEPPVVTPEPVAPARRGRFGGALAPWLLLPLLGAAWRRQRRR